MRFLLSLCAILLMGLGDMVYAKPDGCDCGKEETKTPTRLISISALDMIATTEMLKIATQGIGWTAGRIAQAVSIMIADTTTQLNAKIRPEFLKMIAEEKRTFEAKVIELTRQAQFQPDLTRKELCCDQATWADGAADKAGVTAKFQKSEFEM